MDDKKPKMTRSERLRLQAFKDVQERLKPEASILKSTDLSQSIPRMTENERAKIQAFKNVQERRKEQDKAQIKN